MTKDQTLPIVWMGGKGRIASDVWSLLGDPKVYVEPFAGSASVFFKRPLPNGNEMRYEVLNDIDGFIVNTLRALKNKRKSVKKYLEYPLSEADLLSRNEWLCKTWAPKNCNKLKTQDDFCSAKAAAYWIYGASGWFGSGWCSQFDWSKLTVVDKKQLQKLPQLACRNGVFSLINRDTLNDRLESLQRRLQTTVIPAGDWKRVCSMKYLISAKQDVGMFLDPPYSKNLRTKQIYSQEAGATLRCDIENFCKEWGTDKRVRIVLCGMEGEYSLKGWKQLSWSNKGGAGRCKPSNSNRHKETIWASPHCNELPGE